jgi:uncharacterized SAM-binding protein YcdF (DUF218 family)
MQRLHPRLQRIFSSRLFRRFVLPIIVLWLTIVLLLCGAIVVYGSQDFAQPADVIIVLGAGLHSDNTPTTGFWGRTEHAAELWERGLAPVILCSGGLAGRATRSEASVCGELLQQYGVPSDAIVLEEHSRSTEENALDSRAIMEVHGWRTAVVVSDGYHLLRASWLFQRAGIESYTSPVSFAALNPLQLIVVMGREVVAFHWLAVKFLFNLPVTYVPLV